MGRLNSLAGGAMAAALSVCLLSLGAASAADEQDVAAEFKAAKSSIQQQLRDRKRENRLAAVKKLETLPTVDAAKLLLFQGLGSNDEEVRRASFDALATIATDKEVGDFLRTTVVKQWKGKPKPETFAGLAILLASDLPELNEDAREVLKQAAQRREQGRLILITLADELAKGRGDNVYRALGELAGLPLFEDDFAFRRATVQALTKVRSKLAISRMIELLATLKGEVRADIVRYLTDTSGQQLGADAAAWSEWWKNEAEKFEFPPEVKEPAERGVLAQARPPQPAAGPSYYGLPLSGARIVFVIDTSGSMNGPRIMAAKRELKRAIEELPSDVAFNVIAFSDRPYPWQSKLMPASGEFKQNAQYFIELLKLAPRTASYDALEAALSFDTEVIYFLTDGQPFGGKIQNPAEIVRTITRLNQYRRITINSLGIGVGPSGNAFDAFLSTLADQNWGDYERVDR
jgi:hypothetical protein